jgi:hypothetical protein
MVQEGVELGPKKRKPRGRDRFSQQASHLVFATQEADIIGLIGNHVTDKVKVNLHMFGSSMEHWIGGEIGGTNIITPKDWWRRESHTKFTKKGMQPLELNNSVGEDFIFNFCVEASNSSLFPAAPRN